MAFDADVRSDGTGAAVIHLIGDIDRGAEEQLNHAYTAAIADDASGVLLDFSRTQYINSSGIALIVGVLARARAENRTIRARGLTSHYREIFEITRLADFVEIVDDGADAVR